MSEYAAWKRRTISPVPIFNHYTIVRYLSHKSSQYNHIACTLIWYFIEMCTFMTIQMGAINPPWRQPEGGVEFYIILKGLTKPLGFCEKGCTFLFVLQSQLFRYCGVNKFNYAFAPSDRLLRFLNLTKSKPCLLESETGRPRILDSSICTIHSIHVPIKYTQKSNSSNIKISYRYKSDLSCNHSEEAFTHSREVQPRCIDNFVFCFAIYTDFHVWLYKNTCIYHGIAFFLTCQRQLFKRN